MRIILLFKVPYIYYIIFLSTFQPLNVENSRVDSRLFSLFCTYRIIPMICGFFGYDDACFLRKCEI